jgi:hypothetical protein
MQIEIEPLGGSLWMLRPVNSEPALDESFWSSPGPWGRLEIVPILISPSAELIESLSFTTELQPWRFPGLDLPQVAELLKQCGVAANDSATLLADGTWDSSLGVRLLPRASILRRLPESARAALYQWLAQHDPQSLQADTFLFCGRSLEEWFRDSPVDPRTIDLMRPYVYRQGPLLVFADLPSVAAELPGRGELIELAKVLARERTMLVKLHVRAGDDIDELVAYWGRGRRQKDIRPILESLAHFRRGQYVDVVHVLPPLARRLLFTFPTPEALSRVGQYDCLWTAFNFFSGGLPDQPLDPLVARQTLDREWAPLAGQPLLGDLAVFQDAGGNTFHVAVYVADDLLFSKNGLGPVRPWVLAQVEHLRSFYGRDENLTVRYFRRHDLS